jgi:hypothetical protein
MTKDQLLTELKALESLLIFAQEAVGGDLYPAAGAFLDDIEGEATRLALACERLAEENNQPPIHANFLHPNDPAFIPYHE